MRNEPPVSRDYLQTEQEGHRGTCWDRVFGGEHQSTRNDAAVTKALADLPTYSYDWQSDNFHGVEQFIEGLCYAS